jgi:hypothetical protein
MKAWLWLLGALLIALPAGAADWREALSPAQAGKFPPPRPMKAVYRFGWSGMTAAEAKFDLAKAPRGQLKLSMTTKTTGIVRTMWRMDSEHTAYCQSATLRPIRFEQKEVYKDETEATKAQFTDKEVRRTTIVTPLKGPQEKEKKFKFPNTFDLQTGLFFVRSQRMQAGDEYRFVTYPGRIPYYAEVKVVGREKIKVDSGSYDAIKCRLSLQAVTKQMELAAHKKFKNAYAWFSDDKDRLLLKIEADVFVGSVWAELQSVEFEPKP